MPTDSLDHLSYPQVLTSFLTGSWADLFGHLSIIEAPIMFPAMSVVTAMAGLTLQDKLEKV